MDIKIVKTEFIYSVPKLSLMRDLGDEIAFIGRSNAGKSSLINAICHSKDLARTSKTPGRTRHAVVYKLLFSMAEPKKHAICVDLPGFGFATMAKTESKDCEALISSYLKKRRQLRQIVLLLDIRRALDERERNIIDMAKERNVDILIVLTKCDKVAVSKRKPVVNKLAHELKMDKSLIVMHSTHDERYAEALRNFIFAKFI